MKASRSTASVWVRWSVGPLRHVMRWESGLAVLVVLIAVLGSSVSGQFLTSANMFNMAVTTGEVAIMALPMTLIVISGEIDLSVESILGMSSALLGLLWSDHWPMLLIFAVVAVTGALAGLVNGVLVTRFHVPPFIATLGTLGVFTAAGLKYGNGQTLTPAPGSLLLWTGDFIRLGSFTITTGVVITLALYIVMGYCLGRTAWGKHVYAVGDDPEAARLVGIRSTRTLLSVYLVAGLIYAVASWVQIGRTGDVTTDISSTLNLDSITAVVIGGVSLFGGRGVVLGTLFGALIVQVFQTGIALAGVQELYQELAEGLLVIAAVILDQWIRKVRR